MQKQEKKFFEGHRSTFWIKMPFGIGHPPPTHQLQSTCVGKGSRVPNLQTEFNYLDSFKSYGIFSDFVVPTWSPSSLCRPLCPHILLVVPTTSPFIPMSSPLSPSSSCCPHSPQKVPMWSPWSVVSTCCPCRPGCPHIVPVIPTLSRRSPHHPQCPRYPLHPPLPPGGDWGPNQ